MLVDMCRECMSVLVQMCRECMSVLVEMCRVYECVSGYV